MAGSGRLPAILITHLAQRAGVEGRPSARRGSSFVGVEDYWTWERRRRPGDFLYSRHKVSEVQWFGVYMELATIGCWLDGTGRMGRWREVLPVRSIIRIQKTEGQKNLISKVKYSSNIIFCCFCYSKCQTVNSRPSFVSVRSLTCVAVTSMWWRSRNLVHMERKNCTHLE